MFIIYFILGAISASFFNCLAYRYPQSIISPSSYCDNCRYPLNWTHKIPIASYLIYLGRCDNCQKSIPFRYLLSELTGGLLAIYTIYLFHILPTLSSLLWILFICALIDIEHRIVPNYWQFCYLIYILLTTPLSLPYGSLVILIWISYGIVDYYYPHYIGGADIKMLLITLYGIKAFHFSYSLFFCTLFCFCFMMCHRKKYLSLPFIPFFFLGTLSHTIIYVIHNL